MDRRTKVAIIGTVGVVVIIIIALSVSIVKTLTPSKEVMPLAQYYPMEESEVMVLLQNEIYEKKGLLIDGEIYLDYETILTKFNHRFYWDSNENVLTYTTPDEILQTEADSNKYSVTKSVVKTSASEDYPIVKVFADKVYIALDFVQKYSDLNYQFYENPNRVVINYLWNDYLYTEVKKDTQLRTEASIKSPVLIELTQGTSLMYVDVEEAPKKGFSKVMTEDGIIGYVKNSFVKKSFYKSITSSYKAPEYTAQTRPEKINMVFHQVFDNEAADSLENLIQTTKKVNVVAPTWFSISDESGKLTSLASSDYVDKANQLGLEVWALVDDFDPEVSKFELFSHTSSRENLENSLIEAALKYRLNGINIDFEKITSDTGVHYVEFLRELSVKCRNNGIVLSVDSYVPSEWTTQYDRQEQGEILDYVIVMAYDETTGTEAAGPNSSLPFVQEAVDNILTMVPKEKVIVAIPFFTRQWKEAPDGQISSDNYSMHKAADILKENNAVAKWDTTNGCYYAEYKIDGATYKMWQEDEKSIEEKMKVIYKAGIAGVAEWKLGLEKDSIWDVILRYLN
jgi:spore germination protein YaaH